MDGQGVTLTHAFSPFGSYTVALRVTDDNVPPKTDLTTVVMDVSLGNLPPVADAGGPYTIAVGDDLTLDASGSSDPNTACGDRIVSYRWDLDSDGTFDLEASDPVVTIPWCALAAGGTVPGELEILLRVTDSFGATLVEASLLDTDRLIAEETPWLSKGAVRNLVMRRRIPFRKVGGRLVFIRREIRRWVESAPGIKLELVNATTAGAVLSGIEVTTGNPSGEANPTVDLDVSTDTGGSWLPMAAGLSSSSTIVVATSTSISPAENDSMTRSSSCSDICPCPTPTRASGTAARTRSTTRSMPRTRLEM